MTFLNGPLRDEVIQWGSRTGMRGECSGMEIPNVSSYSGAGRRWSLMRVIEVLHKFG
jgi:hypothetical protein